MTEILPEYPYRDDGLFIHNAIEHHVRQQNCNKITVSKQLRREREGEEGKQYGPNIQE